MTSWRRLTPKFVYFAVFTLGLAMGLPPAEGRAPKANVLRFNITPVAGDTVFSDGLSDSVAYQYADYRVAAGAQPVCVGAEATTTSFVFITLNRALGVPIGNNNGPRCSESGGVRRQWAVDIANAGACARLAAYDPDYVIWNGDFTACRLTGADNARMRFANLYANKLPAKTPIAFLISSFEPPPGHGGYEIKSETDATVLGNATERYISYGGTARLHEFIDRATPVEAPFPLRMTVSFVRSTVSQ
jgi:hypothetical protein